MDPAGGREEGGRQGEGQERAGWTEDWRGAEQGLGGRTGGLETDQCERSSVTAASHGDG